MLVILHIQKNLKDHKNKIRFVYYPLMIIDNLPKYSPSSPCFLSLNLYRVTQPVRVIERIKRSACSKEPSSPRVVREMTG
jgi:hypothetical protein